MTNFVKDKKGKIERRLDYQILRYQFNYPVYLARKLRDWRWSKIILFSLEGEKFDNQKKIKEKKE